MARESIPRLRLRCSFARLFIQFRTQCELLDRRYNEASTNLLCQPDWPLFFSHAEDIQEYLEKVVDVFHLRKYMLFNSEVMGCHWNEVQGIWTVKIVQTLPDGTQREIQDTCDLLLQCTGVLSRPKLPKIEGLDRFKGKVSEIRFPTVFDILITSRRSIIQAPGIILTLRSNGRRKMLQSSAQALLPFRRCQTCRYVISIASRLQGLTQTSLMLSIWTYL